jgi:hypothetical protein
MEMPFYMERKGKRHKGKSMMRYEPRMVGIHADEKMKLKFIPGASQKNSVYLHLYPSLTPTIRGSEKFLSAP